MPREIKGDRAYHEALRRLGVQNPGEIPIGVPIDMVAKVDDLSHLAPPLGLHFYAARATEGMTVGEFSGLILQPGGGGCYVQHASMGNGDSFHFVQDLPHTITPANMTAVIPWGSGEVGMISQSALHRFHETAANLAPPASQLWFDMGVGWPAPWCRYPIYVAPGQAYIATSATVSTVWEGSIAWLEVPGVA
jgi:hypothetical protein